MGIRRPRQPIPIPGWRAGGLGIERIEVQSLEETRGKIDAIDARIVELP